MTKPYLTNIADAAPGEWFPCPGGGRVMMPGTDTREGIYARLTQPDQVELSKSLGATLIPLEAAQRLIRLGGWIEPVLASEDMAAGRGNFLSTYRRVDAITNERLASAVKPLLVAKIWLHTLDGTAINFGMPRRRGDVASVWQGPGRRHDPEKRVYGDYSQLWQCYQPGGIERRTIRQGDRGTDVTAWQEKVGVRADGIFGPTTDAVTRRHQSEHGLVADGIVGARTWATVGEEHRPAPLPAGGLAPAILAARRDVNAAFPGRNRVSDGTWGDASHQARQSDHNTGNAIDITHDPASGCDGGLIAKAAALDPRLKYVIWNREIYNPSVSPQWRKYTGSNPHTSHVHISVREDARNDDRPWPFAPGVSS